MSEQINWTQEKYDDTLTSKVWFYTPFDSGDPRNRHYWEKVSKDEELLDIAAMEMSLEGIPEWVKSVGIDLAPPCGHFAFPEPFLQVLSSIGTANAVTANEGFKHQCWSVTPEWKRTAMDYCLCLDAWLAGASPEIPASELDAFAFRKIDWKSVCKDVWDVLGEPTEGKKVVVERWLIGMRYWLKQGFWDGDIGAEYGRDEYVGDYSRDEKGLPKYTPSARAKELYEKHMKICPDIPSDDWWPCAPKTFRFLERALWSIGKGRRIEADEKIPGFLRCENTYPSQDESAEWFGKLCEALDTWWKEIPCAGAVADDVRARLGEISPIRKWLVRLYLKKLKKLAANGAHYACFANPNQKSCRGSRPLLHYVRNSLT